jgi:hypothetical protein
MIGRDLAAIPAAVRLFREKHSQDELFAAVTRFAILAFAPSEHSKHALLACLSAHELRQECGDHFDDLLTQCAIYASSSRQPWSEPPIGDPPPVAPDQPLGRDELRAAIEAKDRLRGERWLSGNLDAEALFADLLLVASDDFEDFGHKLIVTTAASKLVPIMGVRGRYLTLRTAIGELTAYHSVEPCREAGRPLDGEALLGRLIDCAVSEKGAPGAAHAIFLLDAGLEAAALANDETISLKVRDFLTSSTSECRVVFEPAGASDEVPVYSLARDYGQCLKSHAVAKRLRLRFPDAPLNRFLAATHENLRNGPSFEEYSFA